MEEVSGNDGCTCEACQAACANKPGWFLPGEAEKAAELKGLTLQEFFTQYLSADFWAGSMTDILVISPAHTKMQPGTKWAWSDFGGECVFYNNGLCGIHAAKPFECRAYIHDQDNESPEVKERHHNTAIAWANKQQQIFELLADPEAQKTDFFNVFDAMLGVLRFGGIIGDEEE